VEFELARQYFTMKCPCYWRVVRLVLERRH
jgi:hypothetical protein